MSVSGSVILIDSQVGTVMLAILRSGFTPVTDSVPVAGRLS